MFATRIIIGAMLCLAGLYQAGSCETVEKAEICAREHQLRSLAEASLRNGHPERAVSALQQVVAGDGARAEDYLLLGRAHLDSGNKKQAKKAFQKAIKLGAQAAGYNGLGMVRLKTKGEAMRAMFYFRRALSKDPAFADAQYNLALAYLKMRPLDALEAFEKSAATFA